MGGTVRARIHQRPALIALALVALWVQALVPAGYMVGSGPTQGLVICTGHGPLTDHKQPGGAPTTNHDSVCVFASHGAALTTPTFDRLPMQVSVKRETASLATIEQTPGRGLAAPPPPSRGPPELT
jgi:hypothetical protein